MAKEIIQRAGKFLSGMIMPNIGVFIAWGIVSALFIPFGWMPNEELATLVNPMILYLIPILVGSSGGRLTGGVRGSVVATIATMGVIVSADIPMIIGAMVIGPISGVLIKKFDKAIVNRIPVGFEMIVNNFSTAILGVIMAMVGFYFIGPGVVVLTKMLAAGVNEIIMYGLLPLIAVFIEPAKVLFLNNAINHGVLGPLGIEQAQQTGKSIMFLLEANPGPGLGVLLACYLQSRGGTKQVALGAAIISFFGGIHEIYFPYILRNPTLVFGAIAGGIAGIFTGTLLDAGLVSAASPGSIFALIVLSNKDGILATILCIVVATLVSFLISMILLRLSIKNNVKNTKNIKKEIDDFEVVVDMDINKIVFACDSGIGSSAMGATNFRNRIKDFKLDIIVTNSSVDTIPENADLVISHVKLEERCKKGSPQAYHVFINDFLEDSKLDRLYLILEDKVSMANRSIHNDIVNEIVIEEDDNAILKSENILLGLSSESKEEAITRAGELLVHGGYVTYNYIDSMHEREEIYSTYIGMGVAIPHGMNEDKKEVNKSGVVILQYPNGVRFGDRLAFLVIGVAGAGDEHMEILSDIATSLSDETLINRLDKLSDKSELMNLFSKR